MALATSKTWKTDDDAQAAMVIFIDKLVSFTPDVVTQACDDWGATHERWPTLGGLLKACRALSVEDRVALKLTDPNAPENFLARIKRVRPACDAVWVRSRHHLLTEAIQSHMDGELTDGHLEHCLDLVTQHQQSVRQPYGASP